jgi:site-specific DNA-cytosine methylase
MEPGGLFGDMVSIITQPKDRGILLKDILETEVDEKYYLSQQRIETILKSERSVPYINENTNKHNCLLAGYAKIPTDGQYIVHNTMPRSSTTEKGGTDPLSRTDGKTYCLNTGSTNAIEFSYRQDTPNNVNGKKDCLRANAGGVLRGVGIIEKTSRIRRLTPTECERLQTLPDGYTKKGLEIHFQLFNFTGNEFTICKRFVKKKIVTNQFQAEKLSYATNIIIDFLETGQLNCQEQLLMALKNVSWMVVNENKNHQQKRVLCTIKDGKDMGHLLFPKELINQNLNVSFVIRKLENQEVLECVTNISKCLDYMETHFIQTKKGLIQTRTDIIEIPMESNSIEKLLNKKLVENLLKESKSYIILTLIKLIITQVIYKSLQNQNTPVRINSSIKLQGNSFELELSYIEMENIVSISDSARYKMLGNGWTVEVIKYLFSFVK